MQQIDDLTKKFIKSAEDMCKAKEKEIRGGWGARHFGIASLYGKIFTLVPLLDRLDNTEKLSWPTSRKMATW